MIGIKLKKLREARGLNQDELSKKLNIEQSTLANYENNRRTPKTDILIEIANYFNVTTDYLLGTGIFNEECQNLVILYRNVILNQIYKEELITKKMYGRLLSCNDDSFLLFMSTIITDISGDKNKINYKYMPSIGVLGKEMFKTLTLDEKDDYKHHVYHESQLRSDQQEIMDKIADLPSEQQKKILDYITISYEIENLSSVAADENLKTGTDKLGK